MRQQKISIKRLVQTGAGEVITAEITSELLIGDDPVKVGQKLRQIVEQVLPDTAYQDDLIDIDRQLN